MDAGDARAAIAIALYRRLYAIESAGKDEQLSPDVRKARRLAESVPILDELRRWVDELHFKLTPSSLLAKATTYTRNQWDSLVRFLEDGRLELDNGAVERELRRVAIGRKNYLFAGSDEGAERAAIAYTVLASAKMHSIDPLAYLTNVMRRLQDNFPFARIDELLPDRWAHERRENAHAQ